MLYRIHTEDKNRKWIIRLFSENFKGFSVIPQIGFWNGQKEKSLCIEIDKKLCPSDNIKLELIIKAIKGYNQQECVMLQRIELQTEFI